MDCSGSCRQFCIWIERMPYHRKYVLTKEICPYLPECFSETVLGEMTSGALRQLRGPHGAHVHEFKDRWVIHRDRVNADEDPFGHLIQDAPEYLCSLAAVLLTGLALGKSPSARDRRTQAAVAGGLAGLFALIAGKALKLVSESDEETLSSDVSGIDTAGIPQGSGSSGGSAR